MRQTVGDETRSGDLIVTGDLNATHATSHESGGVDEIEIAPSQVTGTAVVDNDARLLPAGGTTGQVLAKVSATDYDSAWLPYVLPDSPKGTNRLLEPYFYTGTQFITPAEGTIFWQVFYVPIDCTVDQLAIRVTSAGTSGAAVRLGLYSSTNNSPTSLIVQGSIDGTSTGNKNLSVNLTLAKGFYWLANVTQGQAATRPSITGAITGQIPAYPTSPDNFDRFQNRPISAAHGQGNLPSTAPSFTGGSLNGAAALRLRFTA